MGVPAEVLSDLPALEAEVGPTAERIYASARSAGPAVESAVQRYTRQLVDLTKRVYNAYKRVEPVASAAALASVGYQAVEGHPPFAKSPERSMLFLQRAYRDRPDLRQMIDISLRNIENADLRAWGAKLAASIGRTEKAENAVAPLDPKAGEGEKFALIRAASGLFGQPGSLNAVSNLRVLMAALAEIRPKDCDRFIAMRGIVNGI